MTWKSAARVLSVLLSVLLSAGTAQAERPSPSSQAYPPYIPVGTRDFPPAELLAREARWIRNQVWSSGDLSDASAYLFPRSYDVASGYDLLGTDYFSWMLEHNAAYYQYDLAHDDHQMDVPTGSSNDAAIERVMMGWGANSYDMACWAIAMSSATRNGHFSRADIHHFNHALVAYNQGLGRPGLPLLAGIGFNAQTFGDPASQMSGEWTWAPSTRPSSRPTSTGS